MGNVMCPDGAHNLWSLVDCPKGRHNGCGHHEDAGVKCQGQILDAISHMIVT